MRGRGDATDSLGLPKAPNPSLGCFKVTCGPSQGKQCNLASGVFLLQPGCPHRFGQAHCSVSSPDTGHRPGLSRQLERDKCGVRNSQLLLPQNLPVPSSVTSPQHSTKGMKVRSLPAPCCEDLLLGPSIFPSLDLS